jgi:hypothetical protein
MIELYIPKFLDILYEDSVRDNLTFNEVRDAFHSNQMISKTDAILGFSKLPSLTDKRILYIGSWFGVFTRYLCEHYPSYTVDQVDPDSRLEQINKKFCEGLPNYGEYFNMSVDLFENLEQYSTVINLSTEHMSDNWYQRLLPGTKILMQSNNFELEDHINTCKTIDEMKLRYPLSSILYENTIELNIYNRFTLVGIK